MRLFFSLVFCLFSLSLSSQVFDFEQDWLGTNGFFKLEWIQSNGIESIQVSISEKKDGSKFQKELPFVDYFFNVDGSISKSKKYLSFHNKTDTLVHTFRYNTHKQLIEREERDSRFHFNYSYSYQDRRLNKEIKINKISGDTAYLRYFKIDTSKLQNHITLFNSIKKPFSQILETYNKRGALLSKRTSYTRNSNYWEQKYHFRAEHLIQKELIRYFRKKESTTTQLYYKTQQLDMLIVKKEELLLRKFAITYSSNGFPKEIIERDVLNQKVKIYRLSYSPYANQN